MTGSCWSSLTSASQARLIPDDFSFPRVLGKIIFHPGTRHDAYCFKKHGLDQLLGSSTLADQGYVGLGLVTPNKKPAGGRLSRNRQVVNRQINRLRSVVERVIAGVKVWRVLHSGFRRLLGVYGRVFAVGRGLVFYAVGGTFE